MAEQIKIFSINVNGLRDKQQRLHTFQNLLRKGADICLLQETHSVSTDDMDWTREWREISGGGNSYFNHSDNSGSRGVAILTLKHFAHTPKGTFSDQKGRILTLVFETQNTKVQIMSIYGPNRQKERFFQNLDQFTELGPPLIVGGDFNMVENNDLDRSKCRNPSTDGQKAFHDFKTNMDITDPFRTNNPDKKFSLGRKLL